VGEIDFYRLGITLINVVVLAGLPGMLIWHIVQAKKQDHLSDGWMVQILIIFVYGLAISAEIPALWSRWIAYYTLDLKLPPILYALSGWDRWLHLFFYVILFLLTAPFPAETKCFFAF